MPNAERHIIASSVNNVVTENLESDETVFFARNGVKSLIICNEIEKKFFCI